VTFVWIGRVDEKFLDFERQEAVLDMMILGESIENGSSVEGVSGQPTFQNQKGH